MCRTLSEPHLCRQHLRTGNGSAACVYHQAMEVCQLAPRCHPAGFPGEQPVSNSPECGHALASDASSTVWPWSCVPQTTSIMLGLISRDPALIIYDERVIKIFDLQEALAQRMPSSENEEWRAGNRGASGRLPGGAAGACAAEFRNCYGAARAVSAHGVPAGRVYPPLANAAGAAEPRRRPDAASADT